MSPTMYLVGNVLNKGCESTKKKQKKKNQITNLNSLGEKIIQNTMTNSYT